jgi:GT2 family glycosyltransferase
MGTHLMGSTDIILVNYNGAEDTIMCIKSLWQMDRQDFRIIVVENASTDNSARELKAFTHEHKGCTINAGAQIRPEAHKLILILSDTNKGFAAGNNLGIHLALNNPETGFIWLLNNDTVVDKQALGALLNGYAKRQQAGQHPGILGSKIRFFHDRDVIQAVGGSFDSKKAKVRLIGLNEKDRGQYDGRNEALDMILGASMFADVNFVKTTGMLNEAYFLYFEELDWSFRAKQQGFSTFCETGSIVYHKQGQATGNNVRGKKSEFAMYHIFTSMLIFYRTYYPKRVYRAKIRILIRLVKFQLKGKLNSWRVFKKVFF